MTNNGAAPNAPPGFLQTFFAYKKPEKNDLVFSKKLNEFWTRSYSQLYKNVKLLFQNGFRWFDIFLWPLITMLSITFFIEYLQGTPRIFVLVILGMMGWRAVYHAQFEIAGNYMEEYWSNSLTHLFITPIRLSELVFGGVLSGLAKSVLVGALFYLIGHALYGFLVPDWSGLLLGGFFLFLFGTALGMITLGLMFRFTSNAFPLAYTLPDIFVLLSGVYYPITVLPKFIQPIAQLLPSTHAFNLIKATLGLGTVDWGFLVGLSAVWLAGAFILLQYFYREAKKSGRLVRVA